MRVLTTVLIYWVGYQSVLQLRVLNERKYIRKQLKNNPLTKYQETLKEKSDFSKKTDNTLNIPKEIINTVLIELELFEKGQEYTSKKITLVSLSKKLNTNTNYLSKIINHYKNTSFSNYLNILRINNIVYQLKNDATIRKFTIKAIASEAGFNNSDSFSKVFFKLKGVNPSDYIKKLK